MHACRSTLEDPSIRWDACLETAREVLRMLGEPLPARPGRLAVGRELVTTRLLLRGRALEALRGLPDMTDPRKLAAIRVIKNMAAGTLFSEPDLYPILVLRIFQLTLRHGSTGESAVGYVGYGLLLNVLGQVDTGHQFGQLSLETVERFRAAHLKSSIGLAFQVFIRHWKEPLALTLEPLLQAAQAGLDAGDLEYFSYSHVWAVFHGLFSGDDLGALRAAVDRAIAAVQRHSQEKAHLLLLEVHHLVDALQGGGPRPTPAGDRDEATILERWVNARDYNALSYGHCLQGIAAFFAGDLRQCLEHLAVCDRHAGTLLGQSFVPVSLFYEALAQLGLAGELRGTARARAVRRAAAIRRRFVRWAHHAPMNYGGKLALLEAELGRVRGDSPAAVEQHYERALRLARESHILQDEALAFELAGHSLLSRGLRTAARAHLLEARLLYRRWGATARAASLENHHADLLGLDGQGNGPSPLAPGVRLTSTTTSSASLDLRSLLRAAQALSGEIVLSGLLTRLMRLTLENAGAQRGLLLLERAGVLTLEAEATSGEGGEVAVRSRPVEKGRDLPDAMVNFVLRTKEHVVLSDASREGIFVEDAYVVARRPRSVLCAPLVHQGRVAGLIYLENNLTPGAFTRDRVETVQLLCGQADISIRNAQLYADLERSLAAQVELTTAHSRFVPHQFLQSLSRSKIVDVKRGDHVQKEMSVLFSDLRSFTRLSEALGAEGVLEFINSYLSYVEPPILEAGGFIDNFTGDGVMALFEGPADQAVQGAIALHRALERFNDQRQRDGAPPVQTGVGINTGPVVLGTLGGKNWLKCGVIGDAVNLASRVEGLTKRYGAALLITEHTHRRLADPRRCSLRRVERVRVVGKQEAVTLYEVLEAERPEVREARERSRAPYEEALDCYYARDFAGALARLEAVLEVAPGDAAAVLFAHRCRSLLREPPGEDWDGVEQLTHK